MKIKRYNAKDMRTALALVKEELGVDAVIMSNKKTATGIELVAAIDSEAQPAEQTPTPTPAPVASNIDQPTANVANSVPANNDKVASSLEELLKRQNLVNQTQVQQPSAQDTTLGLGANPLAGNISNSAILNQKNSPEQHKTMPQSLQENSNPVGTMTQALSQQAESEFEQWLSKARDKVSQGDDLSQHNDFASEEAMQSTGNGNDLLDGDELSDLTPSSNAGGELASLKAEMASIKQLLEHQVSSLMWQDVNRRQPIKAMLTAKLKDMGLSAKVAEHMTHFIGEDIAQADVWPKMLELLTEQLDTTDNEIIKRGGVYALVGPTGVGKTTTIAKLAARYAQMYGADKVGLITTDSFRIGALEQLATYAKILGCPLKQAKDVDELSEAIYQLRNKKLVLIDTAGMSQRDIKLTERLNYLLTHSRVNIKNYLVLSATSQMSVLQESVQHFKTIPLSGCIFTKIDESLSLGELMSVAIHNRLPIGYLTNGQRVPEDIRVANSGKIVQKANQLFELKQKVTNQNNKVVPKAVGMYD